MFRSRDKAVGDFSVWLRKRGFVLSLVLTALGANAWCHEPAGMDGDSERRYPWELVAL